MLVVGVEAKACEGFDGVVGDRASAAPPSKKRARCNLLSARLFGRDVFDEHSGAILDEPLSRHGYQLWTAAVGTIIEAQAREQDRAVLLVHQFVPRDLTGPTPPGDTRDWASALDANGAAIEAFIESSMPLEDIPRDRLRHAGYGARRRQGDERHRELTAAGLADTAG